MLEKYGVWQYRTIHDDPPVPDAEARRIIAIRRIRREAKKQSQKATK